MRHGLLRILRLPAVVGVLAAAAAVLALAAAAVDPYLASAGNAAAVSELERIGHDDAGLRVSVDGAAHAAGLDEVTTLLTDAVGGARDPDITLTSVPLTVGSGLGEQRARLAAGSGAVAVLTSEPGDGIWIPDVLADDLSVTAGDEVALRRGDEQVDIAVAGVYEALDADAPPAGLESLAEMTRAAEGRDGRPPDLLFLSSDAAVDLASAVDASLSFEWAFPAPALSSLAEARAERSRLAQVRAAAQDPRTSLGGALDDLSRAQPNVSSGVATVVREAERAVAALSGAARAAGLAGQAVALVVLAAAAVFAARQRATEYRLATIRGRGPVAQGARTALESVVPLVAGGLGGWAAAMGLVSAFGPPGDLPAGTAMTALSSAALALLPALAVVLVATAATTAGTVRSGRRRRLRGLANAPWELAVLGLAAAALVQLRAVGGLAVEDGSPALSPLVLAFPVLLLAGSAGLAARGLRRVLPTLRRRTVGPHSTRFLALRRLGAAPTPAIVLTAASAMALGLVVYTAALSDSLGVSVTDKASVQIGAQAVAGAEAFGVAGAPETSASAGGGDVTRVGRTRASLQPSGEVVDVVLADPASFPDVAFSDRNLAGVDLGVLLDDLGQPGDTLHVAASGLDTTDPVSLDVAGARVAIDVAATPDGLPGQSTTRPLVLADADALYSLVEAQGEALSSMAIRWELWGTGSDATGALAAAGADPDAIRLATDAAEQPRLVAVTWALGALQAFGVLASGLALAGVLLFVASRQRSTQVSYALSRRMGLARSSHRAALAVELLALLGLAMALATVFGLVAAGLVAGQIDPLPDLPPGLRLGIPMPAIGGLLATLGIAGVGGAVLLQRRADRSDVAEVLRSA